MSGASRARGIGGFLLARLLLLGVCVACALAVVRGLVDYRHIRAEMDRSLESAPAAFAPAIAESLWVFDAEVLAELVRGLAASHYIAHVAVTDGDRVLAEAGTPPGREAHVRGLTLSRESLGRTVTLGELLVVADPSAIRGELFRSLAFEFGFLGVTVLCIVLGSYWLIEGLVTRHLVHATEHFSSVEAPDRGGPLVLDRPPRRDELQILAEAYNGLEERLRAAMLRSEESRIEAEGKGREHERALREEEALVREVLHRTRNNLQTILALLYLQKDWDREADRDSFVAAIERRVQAMAAVQGLLHGESDLSRVSLDDCLRELCRMAFERAEGSCAVSLDLRLEPVQAPIDLAMPLGLAVAELLSNAATHGLAARSELLVRISLASREGRILLLVEESGRERADGASRARSPGGDRSGTGLRIARHLVEEQLRGRLESGPGPGGTWVSSVALERPA